MGDSTPPLNNAQVSEERVRCYELRLKGKSIRAIAKEVGLSPATVHRRITAECDARELPLADEVRKQELDRMDTYLEKLWEQIEDGRQVARNVEVAMKVAERRAKMLGIDAAERQEITATVETRPEVMGLVERARAEMEQKEAELRGESS